MIGDTEIERPPQEYFTVFVNKFMRKVINIMDFDILCMTVDIFVRTITNSLIHSLTKFEVPFYSKGLRNWVGTVDMLPDYEQGPEKFMEDSIFCYILYPSRDCLKKWEKFVEAHAIDMHFFLSNPNGRICPRPKRSNRSHLQ